MNIELKDIKKVENCRIQRLYGLLRGSGQKDYHLQLAIANQILIDQKYDPIAIVTLYCKELDKMEKNEKSDFKNFKNTKSAKTVIKRIKKDRETNDESNMDIESLSDIFMMRLAIIAAIDSENALWDSKLCQLTTITNEVASIYCKIINAIFDNKDIPEIMANLTSENELVEATIMSSLALEDEREFVFKRGKLSCLDNLWCCIRSLAHFEEPSEAFIWMEEIEAPKSVLVSVGAILGSFYGDSIELESTLESAKCLEIAKQLAALE
jgi:hypothetical protein